MWLLAPAAAGDPKIPVTGSHNPRRLMLAACIAGLMSTGLVAQARAQDRIVIETGVVRMGDLDLATAHGARVLVRRVTAKASDLCTQTPSPLVHGADKLWRACVAKAVARSIARVNAPLVTAEYARAFGAAPSVVSSR